MLKEERRLVRLGDIKPHPLNSFFFDDITGDKWEDFKVSVSNGLINDPILTDSLVLVSGHQRIRAKKENGASDDEMIPCCIRWYSSEQEILRELIETNIQQRGTLTCSAVKMGRIAMALEEINGIRWGGDTKSTNGTLDGDCKTQADIAAKLNENMGTYKRNKQIAQLPPEFQEMIDRGQITPSTGARLIARMDEESQQKLLQLLPTDVVQRFTQAQIQEYIDQIDNLQSHLEIAQKAISGGTDEWLKLTAERDNYKQRERTEFEENVKMKKEVKESEKRLARMQDQWELAQARADGTMFEGTALTMIDSALNGFIRSMDYIKQSDHCISSLNKDQLKYISSLFGKSLQLAREVSQLLRAA